MRLYPPKDNYALIFFMILGLVITLPFAFVYRSIKFLME
jgi:hypothetical protein